MVFWTGIGPRTVHATSIHGDYLRLSYSTIFYPYTLMKDIRYIKMTDKEKDAWIRAMAKLCIDMYLEENGILPPTPSTDENSTGTP